MNHEEVIEEIVNNLDINLYDVESVRDGDEMIYRVYISHKDGISLDKCVEVTHLISPILDTNPPLSGNYRLEVSSPGLERKLKRLKQFLGSIGELVKITTSSKDVIRGKLLSANEESITVEDTDTQIVIPHADIKKARTYIKW
ncbi:MAG: ribosome maturation factor RimP [Desulfocapsa sp.]|nr:MAG: ribosome maturation factor RimP [Desulfocapsa sp.]